MNWIKKTIYIIIFNIVIFVFLIIIVETIFFGLRKILDRPYIGWIIPTEQQNLVTHPCVKMMTHPILSHAHDHNNECKIKNGYAIGEYVYYNNSSDFKEDNVVIALGGSSTDGWYQHQSKGETWPKALNDLLIKNKLNNWSIINGGVGAYNSSQELLKLLTSASILKENIKIIISLNGPNELPGYLETNDFLNIHLPFFTRTQAFMLKEKKWLRQNKNYFPYFPNINSFIRYITRSSDHQLSKEVKNYTKDAYENLVNKNVKFKTVGDRWESNVRMMNAISNEIGAKYYVFLQPTLGLEGKQSHAPNNSRDKTLLDTVSDEYINDLNILYQDLRKKCNDLAFCYYLPEIIYPIGDIYYDGRHFNEKGNKILANTILNFINIK